MLQIPLLLAQNQISPKKPSQTWLAFCLQVEQNCKSTAGQLPGTKPPIRPRHHYRLAIYQLAKINVYTDMI